METDEGENPEDSLAVPTFKKQRGKGDLWKESRLAREGG